MRTVTTSVVLTDLVDSRDLSARLGPEAAGEARSMHLALVRNAVEATGGTEAKNLGHGLLVVYPSLGAALDGAVAIQQAIEVHNRRAPVPMVVGVGLSSGDAMEEDGEYSGEPVIEATRLCSAAAGGQIVTSEIVSLLARRTDHRFGPLGAVELDGLPPAVEAWEVIWAPAKAVAMVPLPRRLAPTPTTGVVGRILETEHLFGALKATMAGEGHRLVLLSGEPGIGKTTLAGDLAQRAHSDGATVLYGRSDEDLRVPYQPFVEALDDLVANAGDQALSALDERHLSELSRLVPQVRRRLPELDKPPSTDAEAERHLLFGAVTAVLAELAQAAPVLLVLDDLHWADKPTVLLLRHLVATLDHARVLVVGTYRDSDLTASHPLTEGLVALRTDLAVDRLAVRGLDEGGVVALLEGLAGHEMDGAGIDLARAVRRETDGNPFFTAEMLRYLAETDAIRQEDGRWVAAVDLSSIGLPESVREVVGQRVRSLGEDAHQVLTVASVMGRDFDVALLARAAERDRTVVSGVLQAAAAAQIVADIEGASVRFTFTHALFQRTLYDELSASRRARTHRRIGELLEADCGDDPGDRIGELAHHWMAATKSVDVGKAARYAHRAGEQALTALAPDEAIRWFRQTVELLAAEVPGDALLHLDALIGLGDAQRHAGDPEFRETLLAAAASAAALEDTDRLVAAALANQRGMVSGMGTVDVERISMLELALDALDDGDSAARARLLATLAAELSFRVDRGDLMALAVDAEEMARRLGDDAVLLRVLNLAFLPLWWPDNFDRTLASTQEALVLADRVGDPVAKFWAAMNRTMAMATSVDREGIDTALDLAGARAQEIGLPYPILMVLQARCAQVLLAGDADEADRLGMEALQIGMETGQPDAMMMFGANLISVRFHQGRIEEILPIIEQAAADNPGLPGFQAVHALMLCECGRLDEARTMLEAARAEDFHRLTNGSISPTTTAFWAETTALLRDADAAAILYERMAPYETQGVAAGGTFSGTMGMSLAHLAVVLGLSDAAARHFEQADTQLRALGAPFWHSRNQVGWANLLIDRGTEADLQRARELLVEATATAAANGCGGVERRANELTALLP